VSTAILLKSEDLASWLPEALLEHQISARYGLTALTRPLSIAHYDKWLEAGHQGEMSYLERHRDIKATPSIWIPDARSAIVFAIDYVTREQTPNQLQELSHLRTALYTRFAPDAADYHDAIRQRLTPILNRLQALYPSAVFRLALDAEPVLERDLAVRAGLGWVGKNTCIIDRGGGSLFFIAEILTSLECEKTVTTEVLAKEFCGSCTKCIDACPTGALIAPKTLDATKCISYWTIESKKIPEVSLSQKFGDWFFGCDICQTVCPWNGKVFGREKMEREQKGPGYTPGLVHELRFVLTSSNRELQRRFAKTPLARSRGFGLKRNALIVTENLKLTELTSTLENFIEDPHADSRLTTLARRVIESLRREA
jgi:epoxyqueuosine reductase